MAAHSYLLDLHTDPSILSGDRADATIETVTSAICGNGVKLEHKISYDSQGFLLLFSGPRSSHLTARGYPATGLLTVTLEEFLPVNIVRSPFPYSEMMISIEKDLREKLSLSKMKRLPPVKRGADIDQYVATSDERLVEYDFDKVVFEADSPYQNIKILHSPSFGNMLILDNFQNIAESDLIYTQTLMLHGQENYAGKTVLILGGGDGGLLHELLKENPAFVTMIEIDEVVINACKDHLRGVCGDSMDKLKGANYHIIVDDCIAICHKFIEEGKKFDYVFGDLTDIPITPTPQGEFWDFMRSILHTASSLLNDAGKLLIHGNGVNSVHALNMFEEQLDKLAIPVEYKKRTAHVPSFMETWVFYEISRKVSAGLNGVENGK